MIAIERWQTPYFDLLSNALIGIAAVSEKTLEPYFHDLVDLEPSVQMQIGPVVRPVAA